MTTYFLQALANLSGNAPWAVRGNDAYANIDWQGNSPACTEAELNAEIARLRTAEPYLETWPQIEESYFQTAYTLWVKKEVGLATQSEYDAAVAAIKTTYSI